jgi:serine/threonine-protein kinase RsbW
MAESFSQIHVLSYPVGLSLTSADPVVYRYGSVPRLLAAKITETSLRMAWRESGNLGKTQTTLDSTLQSVDKAEEVVMQEAHKLGFDEDEQHQIGMAVRECMVNAVVHGNRYNRKKRVHLTVELSKDSLTVIVGDEGGGFDINSLPDPLSPENLLNQSGRGILLIRAFMDEFDVHPRLGGGTEVRLVKNLVKS